MKSAFLEIFATQDALAVSLSLQCDGYTLEHTFDAPKTLSLENFLKFHGRLSFEKCNLYPSYGQNLELKDSQCILHGIEK